MFYVFISQFLLGEMLQKEGVPRAGPYGRPIMGLIDFWVRLYNGDFPFPYKRINMFYHPVG